jgi:site-specific recombinase XerD
LAPPARGGRGKYTGHENDEGERLFDELLIMRGCSKSAIATVKRSWAPETFRKYRHTLTLLGAYMHENGMEHATLLDDERAAGCALSFLAERKDQGESGASVKRMSGELHMLLQLFHGTGNDMMERMGKGLRREFPRTDGIKDTIWDIDVLLNYIQSTYPRNEDLTREELLHKTMILFMVFAASRPVELVRMETPDPRDVGSDEARVRAIPKQRGNERTSVIIHKVSTTSLCPLEALKEWLRRRGDISPLLFTGEFRSSSAAGHSMASACASRGHPPAGSRGCPPRQRGITSRQHVTPPVADEAPTNCRGLTTTYVRAAFKALMVAAGIPERYPPYSIRHATVTALFQRGASDEEVVAYGRWARGSRVPRLFYFIHATDGAWIGQKLLAEQPALRGEATLRELSEEGEETEAEDEQPSASSSGEAS